MPIAGYFLNVNAVISNRWLSPLAATFAFLVLGVGTIIASARDPHASVVRSSVEKKVRAAVVGALVLLFVGAGFTYRASVNLAESVHGISRSEQLRDALASLHVALIGTEAAQTAYLVTSRQQDRNEYEQLAASAQLSAGGRGTRRGRPAPGFHAKKLFA